MDAEPNVTEMLNRAVATVEPRIDLLVSGGAQRGRTLRRRRRLAQLGSGAALTGLIAAVTVAVWPSASTAGQHSAASPQTSAVNRPTVGVPDVPKQKSTDDSVAMTPQLLLKRTLDLLPGHPATHTYTGRSFAGWVGAEFVYNDGQGPAQIDVSMGFTQDDVQGAMSPCEASDPDCSVLADGSHLQVFRGPEYSQGHLPYNATEWSIDLVRPGGVEVTLSEWNSSQEKDAPITRAQPPLSVPELTAIARSDTLSPQVSRSDADQAADLFVPDQTYEQTRAEDLRREAEAQARAERSAALQAEARREAAKEATRAKAAKAAGRAHQH